MRGWKLHDGGGVDDSDENSPNAQEICGHEQVLVHVRDLVWYVFVKFTAQCAFEEKLKWVSPAAGGEEVANVMRGHDERLCGELEVDTEGQRKKKKKRGGDTR